MKSEDQAEPKRTKQLPKKRNLNKSIIEQYEQRKIDEIEKFNNVVYNNKKTIKVDQIRNDMRLFGDREDGESDEEEEIESSDFSEESN